MSIQVKTLGDFIGGWFVGSFCPSILESNSVEVGVKYAARGSTEPEHFQVVATEITVVASGRCRLGSEILTTGMIAVMEPRESASFEALEDCILVVVKAPSAPADKVVGIGQVTHG